MLLSRIDWGDETRTPDPDRLTRLEPPQDSHYKKADPTYEKYRRVWAIIKTVPGIQERWVPFEEIRALVETRLGKKTCFYHCNVLWAHGYLEKAVAGVYGGYVRPHEPRRKSDRPGKYYGVHYRMVQDEN